MLDDGAALGRFITRFREQYMRMGYDGFTWELQPGAQERIAQKIAPYWYQIDPKEYAQLPEIVDDIRLCPLDPASRKVYETLERDSILALAPARKWRHIQRESRRRYAPLQGDSRCQTRRA